MPQPGFGYGAPQGMPQAMAPGQQPPPQQQMYGYGAPMQGQPGQQPPAGNPYGQPPQ